ncbi:hypothetical protein BpHYR1_025342 [Brachionus plicatilis]|uniref:Uncharacterized protein n=1 Tax=Brachionus plicatilis TaxID=10195 RepID=A0A3M7RJN7_BRAPC|nr:hypothetical protein BpHYR1_025342 [Brachionus plicatilis]
MDLHSPIFESHDYYFRTETLELQHFLVIIFFLHSEGVVEAGIAKNDKLMTNSKDYENLECYFSSTKEGLFLYLNPVHSLDLIF